MGKYHERLFYIWLIFQIDFTSASVKEEAMYMKKFCIVSDVIGNRDVIHSEYNGYVCKAVDEYDSGDILCI